MHVLFAHLITLSEHLVTELGEASAGYLAEMVLEVPVLALDLWYFCELSPEQLHFFVAIQVLVARRIEELLESHSASAASSFRRCWMSLSHSQGLRLWSDENRSAPTLRGYGWGGS